MSKITLDITVSKLRVLDEVAKTTAYIGSKAMKAEDPGAYERVANVDADREQLERYWMEACSDVDLLLDEWVMSSTTQVLTHHPELDRDYKAVVLMPSNWPTAYSSGVKEAVMSCLVNSIVAKWLLITHKQDAEAYATLAAAEGQKIKELLLSRRRPRKRRPCEAGDGELWGDSEQWGGPQQWEG